MPLHVRQLPLQKHHRHPQTSSSAGYGATRNDMSLPQEWFQSNPLAPDEQETEDRAISINIFITGEIQQWIRNKDDRLFVKERLVAAADVEKLL